ncbi:MAG: hypothetical protein JKY56_05365 [Kofleriaceae bacterium]|nr:hypothetical protein [Kofleriaceae bacterium]
MSSMRRVSTSFHRKLGPLLLGLLFCFAPLGYSPGTAEAIDMQGSSIVIELELPNDSGDFGLTTDEERIEDYFNLANCICPEVRFQAKITLADPASSYASVPVKFWVGNSCDVDPDRLSTRDTSCEKLEEDGLGTVAELLTSTPRISIPVFRLLAPNSQTCDFEEDQRAVYALIDEEPDGIDGEDYSAPPLEIPFDMRPPPAVAITSVNGAENAIEINWDLPSSRQEDIRFIQVLCARGWQ